MFPFRDNTSLSNFSLISVVQLKVSRVVQFPDFPRTANQKFVEDCSSSISGARCELDELSDVSKISLELAVSTTSLIFLYKLCDTVLGMRGVGGGRLRGELRFQAKTEGTAPFPKETTPLKLFFSSI